MGPRLAKWLKHGATPYVGIVALALLTFATFNVLFAASKADDYPREVIAALIAAIITTVITQILLGQQSRGEELRERNVEVFKRRLEVYRTFTAAVLSHLEDRELSPDEAHDLRRQIYEIALISNPDTVSIVTGYVRSHMLHDDETGVFADIGTVVEAFRFDLGLKEPATDGLAEMGMIDRKLSGEINDAAAKQCQKTLYFVRDALIDALLEKDASLFEGLVVPDAYGCPEGVRIDLERRPGTSFGIVAPYDVGGSDGRLIGEFDFSMMPTRERARLKRLGLSCEFQDDLDEAGYLSFCVATSGDGGRMEDGSTYIHSIHALAHAIIEIERTTDECEMRPAEEDFT